MLTMKAMQTAVEKGRIAATLHHRIPCNPTNCVPESQDSGFIPGAQPAASAIL